MKKSAYFILLCLAVFFLFYGIRYAKRPEKSQLAMSEVYENKVVTSGYIVRYEYPYKANADGSVYHYIAEGTKVKNNSALMTVYTGEVSEQTIAELNAVAQKLEDMQNANSAYSFGSNSKENLDTIKDNIIRAANRNELDRIEEYESQLVGIATGNITDTRTSSAEELQAKKTALENALAASKSDIYSDRAGVYSKNVDGLEETLVPSSVLSYKIADYKAISAPKDHPVGSVTKDQTVCKVVNNQVWYVLTTVDAKTASKMKEGQTVKLRFDRLPGIEANGEIQYISKEDSAAEANVVVIKCEQYKEGVYSLRKTGIEIILESYEGYRVPIYAIRTEDGEKGIMVQNEMGTHFRKCNILYTNTAEQTVIVSKEFNDNKGKLKDTDMIIIGEK